VPFLPLFKKEKDRKFLVTIIIVMIILKILGFSFVIWYANTNRTGGGMANSDMRAINQFKLSKTIMALGYRWDSIHYVNISLLWRAHFKKGEQLSNYGYFFPIMIMLVSLIVRSNIVAAILVSNVFSILTVLLFYSVCRLYLSEEKSFAASIALAIYPSYFVAGLIAYSEPLFLYFTIGSWYYFENEDYAFSSVFLLFSIYTRTSGVILIPVYVLILIYYSIKRSRENKKLTLPPPDCLWLIMPAVFFISQSILTRRLVMEFAGKGKESFSGFLGVANSRFYPVTWPGEQFRIFFKDPGHGADMYMRIIPAVLLGIYLKKFRPGLVIYAMAAIFSVLCISKPEIIRAIPRHLLNAWPVFIALGDFLENRYFLAVYSVFFLFEGFKTLNYYFTYCYI